MNCFGYFEKARVNFLLFCGHWKAKVYRIPQFLALDNAETRLKSLKIFHLKDPQNFYNLHG